MRIVKHVRLFFREGTSDKTYEIDLCETSPGQYIVNFRYGKRGAALKEGSKTVKPVSMGEATVIFDALEIEKRSKGYSSSGELPVAAEAVSELPPLVAVSGPAEQKLLIRLEDALKRKSTFKTRWSTSRVIWKAGEYKLREAAPYIMLLIERGNAMQRYAAIWALGRCGDPAAVPILKAYADNSSHPAYLRQLAANAALMLLTDTERAAYVNRYKLALPPDIQQAVDTGNTFLLQELLNTQLQVLTETSFALLEDLYIVAADDTLVKHVLMNALAVLPLRPSYFRHIRHLLKQAELRDDQALVALLAVRFEKEGEMFRADSEGRFYSHEQQQYVKVASELKKPVSRLAYSARTRRYLRHRIKRRLVQMGERKDLQYVRLATALLLRYNVAQDNVAPYKRSYWIYVRAERRYGEVAVHYAANRHAVYLHYILRGNSADMQLVSDDNVWQMVTAEPVKKPAPPPAAPEKETLLQQIVGLFKSPKKKEIAKEPIIKEMAVPQGETPFLELWHRLPQAFIQLLVNGRMDEIHTFALTQLQASAQYETLKEKIDEGVIGGLLANGFKIPLEYGLQLAREKYNPAAPSPLLFLGLLNSPAAEARELGATWTLKHQDVCFADTDFILSIIFSSYEDVRNLAAMQLSPDKAKVLVSKVITTLLSIRGADDAVNHALTAGCQIVERYCQAALHELDLSVTEALLDSPIPAAQAFGARLLLLKQGQFDIDALGDHLIKRLLDNTYQPVRVAGVSIIVSMSSEELTKRSSLLLHACTAVYTDVRTGIRPVLARLSKQEPALAVWLVNELVPLLMRRETADGLHQDVTVILSNELILHLQDIDRETALRLLYSNYLSAQIFGVLVLEKYIPPTSLTIRQVIAPRAIDRSAGKPDLQNL